VQCSLLDLNETVANKSLEPAQPIISCHARSVFFFSDVNSNLIDQSYCN
jgi:hypothetical protein